MIQHEALRKGEKYVHEGSDVQAFDTAARASSDVGFWLAVTKPKATAAKSKAVASICISYYEEMSKAAMSHFCERRKKSTHKHVISGTPNHTVWARL